MTVQNIVDMAVTGELSNLSVKNNISTVINYINLGMIELYKRFPLSVKEHIIELQDGVEIYDMPSDLMWIVAAYEEVPEDSNQIVSPLGINEEDNPLSVNTVSWNQVQVPLSVSGSYISIIYVASPEILTESDLDKQIALPAQMIEALLHYIGYRAHGALDGNIQAENSTHYQRFEMSCNRIEQKGMFTSDDLNTTDKFKTGTWV